MSIAKFTKVESLFRAALAAGISSTAQTITLSQAPGALTEFPQWFVIEPFSSNYEIIYVPQDDGSATLTNVVRGINPNEDTDVLSASYCKAHPANVDVIMAPLHRHWNELVSVMDGIKGTGSNILRIGDETASNITVYAQNNATNKPYFQYNNASGKWFISNDGVSTYDIASGGSGLTRGPGVDIAGSAITLDVRTSGGLRNDQGTGSAQADVDPTVVARLDTPNTWAAVQTFTADQVQITTNPDSNNDAVRKAYFDANAIQNVFGDGSDGDVTLSVNTTLSRDMFYNNLTMPSTYTLDTAGYKIFVAGTLTRSATGSIFNNGGNGGAGANGSGLTGGAGGTAGTAPGAVTVPGPGASAAGGAGGGTSGAGTGDGVNGSAGNSVTNSIAAASNLTSGAGGTPSSPSFSAGGTSGGTITTGQTKAVPRSYGQAINPTFVAGSTVTALRLAGGGSGAGGGGSTNSGAGTSAGGGGGGAGASGGMVFVAARAIVDSGSGTMFSATGGNGGNGGNAVVSGANNQAAGGGGAGPGGNGGIILRIYNSLTGTAPTAVTGGSAGSVGTNATFGTGACGAPGTAAAGTAGLVIDIIL